MAEYEQWHLDNFIFPHVLFIYPEGSNIFHDLEAITVKGEKKVIVINAIYQMEECRGVDSGHWIGHWSLFNIHDKGL